MPIQNLQALLRAREIQQGHGMDDGINEHNDEEMKEILKLMFEYMKITLSKINDNINKINEEIVDIKSKLNDN